MMRLTRTDQRYSQFARRALDHARSLAQTHAHTAVDSSHLLLGILREDHSIGCQVLREMGVTATRAESQAETRWAALDQARRTSSNAPLVLTPPLSEAISLAADEAHWLGQPYVGTEHLLLGIARV